MLEGHLLQHDPPCYGVPFGLGSTVAVPGRMVFDMEGDRPELCICLICRLFDRLRCLSGLLTICRITPLRPGKLRTPWRLLRSDADVSSCSDVSVAPQTCSPNAGSHFSGPDGYACHDVCNVTRRNLGRGFRYASGADSDHWLADSCPDCSASPAPAVRLFPPGRQRPAPLPLPRFAVPGPDMTSAPAQPQPDVVIAQQYASSPGSRSSTPLYDL